MTQSERRTTGDHGHDVVAPLYVAIVTVSSSRGAQRSVSDDKIDDPGGDTVAACFEDDGHEVRERVLVRDDFAAIRSAVRGLVTRRAIDVVVTTGGTSVSADDVTPEAVS